MRDRTLCFLIRGNPPEKVLLGLKRVGFGAGKYTGIGGKVEAGETITLAAVRELEEEVGIRVSDKDLRRVAHLRFFFPAQPAWSQVVHVFLVARWEGRPVKSTEMMPVWFAVNELPFERMWQDSAYWLPRVLSQEQIRATFKFKQDNESVDEMLVEAWDSNGQNE
jgi:8-oxo-dGTP pyrophosphatase MutT (NUDIX family)